VCNVSFIVRVALCAVFCLSVVCYFVCYVYLCLVVVPLLQGKTPFEVQLNNNNKKLCRRSKRTILSLRPRERERDRR
jgi:hypothetical protein